MPFNPCPEPEAAAIQLVAALQQYGDDVARLAREWHDQPDMEQYARVSREVDDIKSLCFAQQELAAAWVALLVSHTELMYVLWRASFGHSAGAGTEIAGRLRSHAACLADLQVRCRRLLAEDASGLAR